MNIVVGDGWGLNWKFQSQVRKIRNAIVAATDEGNLFQSHIGRFVKILSSRLRTRKIHCTFRSHHAKFYARRFAWDVLFPGCWVHFLLIVE
ncbi:MAG: hypothetical protein IJP89_04695 [Synergistaceae bacterium]|nr:hypothetical protein [Synergistaceae bacterium]